MEVIWHIPTYCLFRLHRQNKMYNGLNPEVECNQMLKVYADIPADGDWDTVEYICKPVGSMSL